MPFDILIRNGRVLDGTGAPARVADVGIHGAAVTNVGRIRTSEAERTIDAKGKYVAPVSSTSTRTATWESSSNGRQNARCDKA